MATWLSGRRVGAVSAEFALIVVGVLSALAVENWTESRKDRAIEGEYLLSLVADLTYNQQHLEELATDLRAVQAHIEMGLAALNHARGAPETSSEAASLYLASRGLFPALLDNAYRDLQATGNLRLVADASLRHRIVAYHRELDRWAVDNYELIRANRLPYRNSIRSRMPLSIQDAIRSNCPLRAVPADRELNLSQSQLAILARTLSEDPDLRRSLTLWASSMRTSLNNVERLLQETRSLLEDLDLDARAERDSA